MAINITTKNCVPHAFRPMGSIVVAVALGVVVVLIAGCTPWATYPPIEGARNVGSPAAEPMPRLMAEAILHTRERFMSGIDPNSQIIFNLPEGATTKLYADAERWMPNARPMESGDVNAIHVTEVRLRLTDAQVDVIYPRPTGHNEFITLFFKKDIVEGWRVTDSRLWRVRKSVPEPSYEIALMIEETARIEKQRATEARNSAKGAPGATAAAPTDSQQPR